MGRVRAAVLALLLAWGAPALAPAQDAPILRSPVLTLDQERLFSDSRAGRALSDALEADSAALASENRQIEAELIAEERDLTERRRTLPPEEFRTLAEAFDEKVVMTRRAQDAKARALAQRREAGQQAFYRQVLPLVAEIVRERGGVVVLERDAVILSAEQVDITDEAIAAIDDRLAPEALEPSGAGPETGGEVSAE
ncbi:OmpH family outer membrane protein [Rhodovulum steppense]|uniref:Periplasmic chaperone for outer membrane proteins Skp n=1 Tax=Rhodovulum steppense TaxID=540251 RepID=A0A4R1YSZ0_9RHOB|nr:OmpH family outer membrane protein [Rhodovulum steppense]TCM83380.1 periplasmic chaperone for outer membrane proteins Skp [Rhodovulum steppense]